MHASLWTDSTRVGKWRLAKMKKYKKPNFIDLIETSSVCWHIQRIFLWKQSRTFYFISSTRQNIFICKETFSSCERQPLQPCPILRYPIVHIRYSDLKNHYRRICTVIIIYVIAVDYVALIGFNVPIEPFVRYYSTTLRYM